MHPLPAWSTDDGAARAAELFAATFAGTPDLVAVAPGRVNLIGEHTDYNGGLCLPVALPHATYAAIRRRPDRRIRLASGQDDGIWEGDFETAALSSGWAAYAAGTLWALGLRPNVSLPGVDLVVTGCVPLGAGLSSSAALEIAVATAALGLIGEPQPRKAIAAGIRAESEVAGAPTGGMDQTTSALAESGHALLLDFGAHTETPVLVDDTFLVVDTKVHHSLSDGGYGNRRDESAQAARELGVPSLSLATVEQLDRLEGVSLKRARHILTENERVRRFVDHPAERGRLMIESHASMRDDYEISCPELDVAVEAALGAGAAGARMTGGGFGGSIVVLPGSADHDAIIDAIGTAFDERGWNEPQWLVATPSAGARVI